MKNKMLFLGIASILLTMIFISCEGTVGPAGAQGPAGSGGGNNGYVSEASIYSYADLRRVLESGSINVFTVTGEVRLQDDLNLGNKTMIISKTTDSAGATGASLLTNGYQINIGTEGTILITNSGVLNADNGIIVNAGMIKLDGGAISIDKTTIENSGWIDLYTTPPPVTATPLVAITPASITGAGTIYLSGGVYLKPTDTAIKGSTIIIGGARAQFSDIIGAGTTLTLLDNYTVLQGLVDTDGTTIKDYTIVRGTATTETTATVPPTNFKIGLDQSLTINDGAIFNATVGFDMDGTINLGGTATSFAFENVANVVNGATMNVTAAVAHTAIADEDPCKITGSGKINLSGATGTLSVASIADGIVIETANSANFVNNGIRTIIGTGSMFHATAGTLTGIMAKNDINIYTLDGASGALEFTDKEVMADTKTLIIKDGSTVNVRGTVENKGTIVLDGTISLSTGAVFTSTDAVKDITGTDGNINFVSTGTLNADIDDATILTQVDSLARINEIVETAPANSSGNFALKVVDATMAITVKGGEVTKYAPSGDVLALTNFDLQAPMTLLGKLTIGKGLSFNSNNNLSAGSTGSPGPSVEIPSAGINATAAENAGAVITNGDGIVRGSNIDKFATTPNTVVTYVPAGDDWGLVLANGVSEPDFMEALKLNGILTINYQKADLIVPAGLSIPQGVTVNSSATAVAFAADGTLTINGKLSLGNTTITLGNIANNISGLANLTVGNAATLVFTQSDNKFTQQGGVSGVLAGTYTRVENWMGVATTPAWAFNTTAAQDISTLIAENNVNVLINTVANMGAGTYGTGLRIAISGTGKFTSSTLASSVNMNSAAIYIIDTGEFIFPAENVAVAIGNPTITGGANSIVRVTAAASGVKTDNGLASGVAAADREFSWKDGKWKLVEVENVDLVGEMAALSAGIGAGGLYIILKDELTVATNVTIPPKVTVVPLVVPNKITNIAAGATLKVDGILELGASKINIASDGVISGNITFTEFATVTTVDRQEIGGVIFPADSISTYNGFSWLETKE